MYSYYPIIISNFIQGNQTFHFGRLLIASYLLERRMLKEKHTWRHSAVELVPLDQDYWRLLHSVNKTTP